MNAPAAQSSGSGGFWGGYRTLLRWLILAAPLVAGGQEWHVRDAPVRFTFRLAGTPSHPEAGYIAHVPDGGLLGASSPRPLVVTPDGQPVDSYTLWHGPDTGLWLVFADPGRVGRVHVYTDVSGQQSAWTPGTGLRPSPLLVTEPGVANLGAAKDLARLGRIGPRVQVQTKAGIRRAPLSVGGDDSGRPRPTSLYLHAYLDTTDPGRTWIAPFFNEGQNEVYIDGDLLKPKKRTSRWGGTGAWFDLGKGLHRVEVFTASTPSGTYATRGFRGHMYLTWQTPDMPASERGGLQNESQPQPGTPRWETRIIKNHEIVRSGGCALESAQARDGGPVACFTITPEQNFWFEGEDALAVFQFEAVGEGNPEDTRYEWSMERGGRVSGDSMYWLVPGGNEHQVTLTATSARGSSSSTVRFYGHSTVPADLNRARDRLVFRLAMQTVLGAYPPQTDPCAWWGDAHWNHLLRTAEYGKGYPLLRNLLGQRGRSVRENLDPEDARMLEDIFLDVAPRVDPAEALQWLRDRSRSASLPDRRAELEIREAEVLMIYLGETQRAADLLATLVRAGREPGQRARIRLGDLYLHQGELNQAARLYASVQEEVRHRRNQGPRPGERAIENWKLGAVKEAAHSATVASLVDSEEYLPARQALDRWERSFPLSKIGEDFVLQEARLYMALTDWKRARWLLEPYCRTVDASSYLPEAAMALIRCLEGMNESPETIRETAVLLKKRLEFHPVAGELEPYTRGE